MPTKPGTVPGYGPGTRPNPNIESVCVRMFAGCGQTSGAYDPTTQKQKGRKSHSKSCQQWWKVSGAAALQSERSCPRMTCEEMVELKKQAAVQHPVEGASGAFGSTAPPPSTAPSPLSTPRFQQVTASVCPSIATAAATQASPRSSGSFPTVADGIKLRPDSRLKAWAETGGNHSLVGLPLRLCFGALGECHGAVSACNDGMYTATWTCGPKHDEVFTSKNLSLEGVLGWHLRTHPAPPIPDGRAAEEWPDWGNRRLRGKDCPLLDAPTDGAQLVDFELPIDGHQFFPSVDTDHDQRWWVTIARLNDPPAANMYAPHIASYPLPWLLTIIIITKEEMGDPSVKLPTLVAPGKKEVYDLASRFARRICNSSGSQMGYGELAALEDIVRTVAATVPAVGATATDTNWLRAYTNIEAMLLTLSHQFEQANDNWRYADSPSRVASLSASIVLATGAVLLNPTSHATRQRVEQDANYLSVHIAAGSYWSDAACTTFAETHPDAAHTWRLLQPRFGVLGAVANETTAANTTTATTGGATGGTWMKREFDDRPSKKELSAALKRHRSIEGIHL